MPCHIWWEAVSYRRHDERTASTDCQTTAELQMNQKCKIGLNHNMNPWWWVTADVSAFAGNPNPTFIVAVQFHWWMRKVTKYEHNTHKHAIALSHGENIMSKAQRVRVRAKLTNVLRGSFRWGRKTTCTWHTSSSGATLLHHPMPHKVTSQAGAKDTLHWTHGC